MSQVVEVRAVESAAPGGRLGPYYRGDRLWQPGWHQHVVDEKVLELITKDPWLEVRVLDAHRQAESKRLLAAVADAEARKAEAIAQELRAKADALLADAKASCEAAAREPLVEAPPPATPFKDAMVAAMPDEVRAQLELDRSAPWGRSAEHLASQLSGRDVETTLPAPAAPVVADAKPKRK